MARPQTFDSVREAVAAALPHLDAEGAFRPSDVLTLRACLAEQSRFLRPPSHPALVFGPWDSLPPHVQAVFRRAVEREITREMDFYPRGSLWPMLASGWATLSRELRRRNLTPGLRSLGSRWEARVWDGPRHLAERSYRRRRLRNWWNGSHVTLDDFVAALGKQPRWLLGDFVTNVTVDRRCRGFHWEQHRNIGFSQLIGLDLIPTETGTWCIEGNLETAFNDERRAVLPEEPSVDVLFREAVACGAKHVVWQDIERGTIPRWLLTELMEAASRHGMSIDIRESHRVPRRDDLPPDMKRPGKYVASPLGLRDDTLVLRRNSYPVGSDYFITNKEPFVRALHPIISRSTSSNLRIPEMAVAAADVFDAPRPGLPNLVYKYPDLDKGEGVYFLRAIDPGEAERLAREIDEETGEPAGLFQPFVCSRLLDGRRIYDVRCELLISPRGARHVFSIRREATRSLPEVLANGRVRSTGVFTSNLATGGRFAPVPPEEAELMQAAALEFGDAIVAALNSTFDTGYQQ